MEDKILPKIKTGNFRKILLISLLSALMIVGGLIWYLNKKPSRIRNVILISIDTCRADRLSCYGFDRPSTPRIDEIAAQGILYKKARSPVPLTLPAHCSILTGTFPPYHRVRDNFEGKLDESHVALAEILQENGFTTGAVISSFVLQRKHGTAQGFDEYYDQFGDSSDPDPPVERKAEEASRLAEEFLRKYKNQSFFLFLHYFDPHYDYIPPEPFASRFADEPYTGEIAYTDHCIGQVIDQLKELGLYDSTLFVIVGDHGEALGEHGESTHGYYIYQSTIHVPFIVRTPGMTQSQEVNQTVSLVDVMPTILGYLELPLPEHIQGEDLSDYSQKPGGSEREVYTETLIPTKLKCNPLRGVVGDQWSYIYSNQSELYDLYQDHGELKNLAGKQTQRVRLMNSRLREMMAQYSKAKSPYSRIELDAESRRRLEGLGYVGGATVDDTDTLDIDPSKRDARRMLEYYEQRLETGRLIGQKEFDRARSMCDKMAAKWPEVAPTYMLLMDIAYLTQKPAEVIEHGRQYLIRESEEIKALNISEEAFPVNSLIKAYDMMVRSAFQLGKFDLVMEFGTKQLQLSPKNTQVMSVLATAYFQLGHHEQAFDLWSKILQLNPNLAVAYNNRGQAYYQLGDLDRAAQDWSQALQISPQWAEVRNNIDVVQRMIKKIDQTVVQLLKALQSQPDDPTLHVQLALTYYQRGRFDMAIQHWRQALHYKPDWPEACMGLAMVLATVPEVKLRQPAEALRLAQKAAELTQFERPDILNTLSIAHAAAGNYTEAINFAEKALPLAVSEGNEKLAESLRQNLKLFQMKNNIR